MPSGFCYGFDIQYFNGVFNLIYNIMNKKLLLILLSFCFISCSVDNDEIYENGVPFSENLSVSSDACAYLDAGPDNSITILESEAAAIPSWDEVRKLYQRLLTPGVTKYGTFNPSIKEIISQFQEESIGDFTTTYTIVDGECSDSVELTVKVRETLDSPCALDAGPDNIIIMEESEAAAIPSWDEVRKLYLTLLAPGVSRLGTFDPSIQALINSWQASRLGDFTTTYTITEGECTDSVELTIRVVEDTQSTPTCEPVSAGGDASKTLTLKAARTQGSTYGSVEQIFFRMLDSGVEIAGVPYSFNPPIDQLIAQFSTSPIGVYQTTLTLGEGECQDSVVLTLTVVP